MKEERDARPIPPHYVLGDPTVRHLPRLAVVERSQHERPLAEIATDLRRNLALLSAANRELLSARGLWQLLTAGREA